MQKGKSLLITMEWHLDSRQSVVEIKACTAIYFRNKTKGNYYRGIMLNWRQLQNLNDIIYDRSILSSMRYYPIGESVWLDYDEQKCIFQLTNRSRLIFFRFTPHAWREYIKHVHKRMFSYFRDAIVSCDQHDANDEGGSSTRLRRTKSLFRQQILPRSSRDATPKTHQRKKYTGFSKWYSTNSRSHSSSRSRKNEKRVHRKVTVNKEAEDVQSDESDFEKHGSNCSIEECSFTGEDYHN